MKLQYWNLILSDLKKKKKKPIFFVPSDKKPQKLDVNFLRLFLGTLWHPSSLSLVHTIFGDSPFL